MPLFSREKPAVNEGSRDLARIARSEIVSSLSPDKIDYLGTGFLGSYRELVKNKGHLEPGERKRVDSFLSSFRKHDKKLIEEKLKDPLVAELTDHIKQITDLLTTGDKAKVEDAKSLAQEDRLVAGSLGLNKDPDIKKQIEAQFVLIETYAKAQSPLRRKLLTRAIKLGTGVAVVGAVGGTGALAGAATQAISSAGHERVAPPGPPPKPKATSAPSTPPTIAPTLTSVPTPPENPTPTLTVSAETKPASPSPLHTITSSPTAVPSPEVQPTATAEPVTEPSAEEENKDAEGDGVERLVEIGDKNLLEFFFGGNRVEGYKKRAQEEAKRDPSFAERVSEKARKSNKITLVVLGTDETRERIDLFSNGQGWGRSDVIKILVIDTSAMKIDDITISRDLFSPETYAQNINFGGDPRWDKVNAGTMMSFVKAAAPDPNFPFRKAPGFEPGKIPESLPFMKKMLETATGLRIDGILQTNIDFMQGNSPFILKNGYFEPRRKGFLDALFPEGLTITPDGSVYDPTYPVEGYGARPVHLVRGQAEKMSGRRLVQYGRSRADTEDNRTKRQNQVFTTGVTALVPEVIELFSPDLAGLVKSTFKGTFKDSVERQEDLLQVMVNGLKEQESLGNFLQYLPEGADYFDLIEFFDSTRQFINDMKTHPKGDAVLGRLAANSKEGIWKMLTDRKNVIREHYVSRSGGVAQDYRISTITLKGSNPLAPPTRLGNYMATWEPLRKLVNSWIG